MITDTGRTGLATPRRRPRSLDETGIDAVPAMARYLDHIAEELELCRIPVHSLKITVGTPPSDASGDADVPCR